MECDGRASSESDSAYLLCGLHGGEPAKDAADPRPYDVKRLCTYKRAQSKFELEATVDGSHDLVWMDELLEKARAESMLIETWSIEDIDADVTMCGLAGSPTKVHKVENVGDFFKTNSYPSLSNKKPLLPRMQVSIATGAEGEATSVFGLCHEEPGNIVKQRQSIQITSERQGTPHPIGPVPVPDQWSRR